jgi:hypothetical protein
VLQIPIVAIEKESSKQRAERTAMKCGMRGRVPDPQNIIPAPKVPRVPKVP